MPVRVENLVRGSAASFATDNLSLDVISGELHAIIGPNGAGKTTLISQLTGQLLPEFRHHPFCRPGHHPLPAFRRRALASRRSFQITSLCPTSPRWTTSRWGAARMTGTRSGSGAMPARKVARDAAHAALSRVGLDIVPTSCVGIEPWRAARTRARRRACNETQLLLLDEPMAGWHPPNGADGQTAQWSCGRKSPCAGRARHASRCFALADRITVLVYGRVSPPALPAAIAAMKRSSGPISAISMWCRSWLTPIALDRWHRDLLWSEQVLFACRCRFARANGGPDGPQRHGQDHTIRSIMGLTPAPRARSVLRD